MKRGIAKTFIDETLDIMAKFIDVYQRGNGLGGDETTKHYIYDNVYNIIRTSKITPSFKLEAFHMCASIIYDIKNSVEPRDIKFDILVSYMYKMFNSNVTIFKTKNDYELTKKYICDALCIDNSYLGTDAVNVINSCDIAVIQLFEHNVNIIKYDMDKDRVDTLKMLDDTLKVDIPKDNLMSIDLLIGAGRVIRESSVDVSKVKVEHRYILSNMLRDTKSNSHVALAKTCIDDLAISGSSVIVDTSDISQRPSCGRRMTAFELVEAYCDMSNGTAYATHISDETEEYKKIHDKLYGEFDYVHCDGPIWSTALKHHVDTITKLSTFVITSREDIDIFGRSYYDKYGVYECGCNLESVVEVIESVLEDNFYNLHIANPDIRYRDVKKSFRDTLYVDWCCRRICNDFNKYVIDNKIDIISITDKTIFAMNLWNDGLILDHDVDRTHFIYCVIDILDSTFNDGIVGLIL